MSDFLATLIFPYRQTFPERISMLFLDQPTLETSNDAQSITDGVFPRQEQIVGSISESESAFLLTTLELSHAKTAIEIGVASGASTFLLLAMLARMADQPKLFAFDALDYFYDDASKPVGYIAIDSEHNTPESLAVLSNSYSGALRSALSSPISDATLPIDFAFIDGSHRHPWAALDVLAILSLIAPGGFIVLHDINLPGLTGLAEDYGPQHVFKHFTGPRRVGLGQPPNIGSIQIVDRSIAVDNILDALREPWEVSPMKEQMLVLRAEYLSYFTPQQIKMFDTIVASAT